MALMQVICIALMFCLGSVFADDDLQALESYVSPAHYGGHRYQSSGGGDGYLYGHGYGRDGYGFYGPFKYGYYGPHGSHVNVDVDGPYSEYYDYGFKAGGGHGHGKY